MFDNTSDEANYYWFGATATETYAKSIKYYMRCVMDGKISGQILGQSNSNITKEAGLRPVVSLKSNVRVTENGVLSL